MGIRIQSISLLEKGFFKKVMCMYVVCVYLHVFTCVGMLMHMCMHVHNMEAQG